MIFLLDNSYEHLGAYVLLHGADRAKYGNLMKGFVNQFLLKNKQYPKTLSDAVDALSNHPFDQGYYDRKKKRKEEAKKRGQKDKEEKETSFKQAGTKFCYCCGDPGHLSPKCPKKDTTPREEWVVNR